MRIPEKPPSDEETQKMLSEQSDVKTLETIRQYLNTVNSEYLHWDELPMRFKGAVLNFKLLWGYVSLFRDFNARAIKINGMVLRYVQTPQIEKSLHDLDMRIGGKMDFESEMPSVDLKKKYLVNSLMEEAIASSQLEGAATSRLAAKQMLRENRKPRNHSEKMILNNYVTMTYIKENTPPNQPLTSEIIKEIHKRMTKDTFENKSYEGTFRTDNEVKVFSQEGQIVHEPPDYKNVDNLIGQVCSFVNSDSVDYYIHPIVKAIILHFMIGYIHPFNDGNGRTARALFYWYLISQKYNYLEYIAVSTAIKNAPGQYARAYLYSETDHNDVTYFIKFNLDKIDIALSSFEKYVEKTRSENKKILETIKNNPKLNIRQVDVIIVMNKTDRPITINEMQERYNVSYQTARTDLLGLEKLGYLHMNTIGKQFIFILDKEKCMSTMK